MNYCQVKDHNGVFGNDAKSFQYFDKLDAVLGTWPGSSSPIVLESGRPTPTPVDCCELESGGCSVQKNEKI